MVKEHHCNETLEYLTQTSFDSNGEFTLTTVFKECSVCKTQYQIFELCNRYTGAVAETIVKYDGNLTKDELKKNALRCFGRITRQDEARIIKKRKSE